MPVPNKSINYPQNYVQLDCQAEVYYLPRVNTIVLLTRLPLSLFYYTMETSGGGQCREETVSFFAINELVREGKLICLGWL